MNWHKAYYSIVQYCPDRSRGEVVNVGVLLFCPDLRFIKARMATSNRRVRRFFGSDGWDRERIGALKASIVNRLDVESERFRSAADLDEFAATRANELAVTPPRPVKVADPQQELDRLFDRLVRETPRRAGPHEPVVRALDQRFREAELDPFVQREVKVRVPLFDREVRVPFAYRNGRLNLVDPVRFAGLGRSEVEQKACTRAIEGNSIYDAMDPDNRPMQLVVVGHFESGQEADVKVVRNILSEFHVQFHELRRLQPLLDDIRKTAHRVAEP